MANTHVDTMFDPPKTFVPIDDAARDGTRQLVRKGAAYAVAQWDEDFWSYPYGPRNDEADTAVQIDFEPTHYSPKIPAEA